MVKSGLKVFPFIPCRDGLKTVDGQTMGNEKVAVFPVHINSPGVRSSPKGQSQKDYFTPDFKPRNEPDLM